MSKKDKVVGAKLSEAQKKQLKDDILKQFPALSIIEDDIDYLIEEYSERNKDIAKELMKKHKDDESKSQNTKEEEDVKWKMLTYKPNTPEYEELMTKLQDVHKREKERQNEIYEKARKELLEKGVQITESLGDLNVETVTIG